MDGHQFTDLAEMCAQTVFRCLHLARIGRPDISWTVSASDRTVTEWNRACAKRLAKLISCLECTSGPPQCCRVGDKGSECRPSVFQSADVAGELADSRSTSGRIVKDDTGGCAVFTERGASASHVTAATVLELSRLPMSGEAHDAVSAYTQVKMSDALRLLPGDSCPKHWDNMDISMAPLGRHLHGHPVVKVLREGRL